MFTELVCTAVAVGLYLNTLDADFCYDDRYVQLPTSPSLKSTCHLYGSVWDGSLLSLDACFLWLCIDTRINHYSLEDKDRWLLAVEILK